MRFKAGVIYNQGPELQVMYDFQQRLCLAALINSRAANQQILNTIYDNTQIILIL